MSAVNGLETDLVHYEQNGAGYGLHVGNAVLQHPVADDTDDSAFAENEEVFFLLWCQVLTLQNERHISGAYALRQFLKIVKFKGVFKVVAMKVPVCLYGFKGGDNHIECNTLIGYVVCGQKHILNIDVHVLFNGLVEVDNARIMRVKSGAIHPCFLADVTHGYVADTVSFKEGCECFFDFDF